MTHITTQANYYHNHQIRYKNYRKKNIYLIHHPLKPLSLRYIFNINKIPIVIQQSMKSQLKQQQKSKQFPDYRHLHQKYRLSHPELQSIIKKVKERLIQEIDDFGSKLVGVLNHLNYLRYMKAYPQDNITFIFPDKNEFNGPDSKMEDQSPIIQKLLNFQTLTTDYVGISDSCIHELNDLISEKQKILNFKQICPSGFSFLKQHQSVIDKLIPISQWEQLTINLSELFRSVSEHFPKEQLKNLEQLLIQSQLKIVSSKLIFRASQHNFQSASFKDCCVGKSPTLLLVKSEKGLIFGGYTPCKWLKTKQQEFVSDTNGKSFLFSLAKNLIFPIKPSQKNYAISAYGGWGPIFGSPYGPDLSISDKCHVNEHSCSSLGSHYEIPPNIKQYTNEAYSLLAGSKNFKVVEYEVYELQIE